MDFQRSPIMTSFYISAYPILVACGSPVVITKLYSGVL